MSATVSAGSMAAEAGPHSTGGASAAVVCRHDFHVLMMLESMLVVLNPEVGEE